MSSFAKEFSNRFRPEWDETWTPKMISREGSFLWETHPYPLIASGTENTWSANITADNGCDKRFAERVATLFAAAPELYDALEDAHKAISTLQPEALGTAGTDEGTSWYIRDELLSRIDAALAKARGEG